MCLTHDARAGTCKPNYADLSLAPPCSIAPHACFYKAASMASSTCRCCFTLAPFSLPVPVRDLLVRHFLNLSADRRACMHPGAFALHSSWKIARVETWLQICLGAEAEGQGVGGALIPTGLCILNPSCIHFHSP